MDGGFAAEGVPAHWRSVVIDTSELPLSELLAEQGTAEDSVLTDSLRRIADDLARPGEPVAGFNSAL